MAWSGRLLGGLAIFVIGRWLLRALTRVATSAMRRVGVDDTLNRFFGNLLYMVLLVFLVLTAFSTLGVPTMNFLAIVGAAGLAVGLALKDSLSNFSSGVMLVFFRPVQSRRSDRCGWRQRRRREHRYLQRGPEDPRQSRHQRAQQPHLRGAITNYNAESTRRIDLTIAIGYDADIPQAKSVITAVVAAESRVAKRSRARGRRAGRAG